VRQSLRETNKGLTALAFSRAETKVAQTDLLASEVALASSRAETRVGQTDLLASESALASSQAQTEGGLTTYLAGFVRCQIDRSKRRQSSA